MANKLWILLLLCSFQGHSQRVLLFANGYLGPKEDKTPRNNGINLHPNRSWYEYNDSTIQSFQPLGSLPGYWYCYDDTLIKRFKPKVALYVSGHHPISTSTHRSKLCYGLSWLFTKILFIRSKNGFGLNKRPNPMGFNLRYENGKICGRNMLRFLKDSLPSVGERDTLDIVCHSMGYAYTLGILTQIDTRFHLGKILILSPESPRQMGYDWNRFDEVWQYGSNLGEKKADLIVFQDGIAPQAAVKNLDQLLPGKGGRLFVPKTAPRGSYYSHHLSKFDWFLSIRPGDYGYFGP